jgi:phosphotransferase system enzyme I (PtsI)
LRPRQHNGGVSARYTGLGVGAGVAVGPVARVHGPGLPPRGAGPVDTEVESDRADEALDAVADEIDALASRAGVSGSVLVRQARIARDPALGALVLQFVRTGRSAARAAWEAFGAYRDLRAADPLRGAPDAAELDDIRDRVVARLLGEPPPGIPDPGTPYVLVARDLSPAVTAALDSSRVLAVVTEKGGPTSHSAVLAKALGIPAVVACAGAGALVNGQRVAVDGSDGVVIVDPDASVVGSMTRRDDTSEPVATGPGRTKDGHAVPLLAAVGGKGDVEEALAAGAEGVGVFRTEFCFLDRAEPPSVAEQTAAYREVFDAFAGLPVTVRTLDVGADKPVSFVRLGEQANPALGVRGMRVGRRHPQLLDDQLVAIARAARESQADVRVMAPMVATPGEAAWFATHAQRAGVGVTGVMVEVPAAALRAADLLQVVDFVSVGSNDLAQYTFAADRADGELAELLDPWQPAFLELVATVIRAGAVAGRAVTVCGEAASDPLLACVFVGLGAAGLSMSPRSIPLVRGQLAKVTMQQAVEAAAVALSADGPEEGCHRAAELLNA